MCSGSKTPCIHAVYWECLLEVRRQASTPCVQGMFTGSKSSRVEPTNNNIDLDSLPHLATLSSLINYDICFIIIVSEKCLTPWVYHLCAKLELI